MRRLLLLRHAKSSWADPGVRDHDRPLNERGRQAASRMGEYLRAAGLVPDRVLCSSARRTCETLVRLELPTVDVEVTRDLYLADPDTVLGRVRSTDDDIGTLLVIGHNPTIQELAVDLVTPDHSMAAPALVSRVAEKVPTGGLVVLTVDGDWAHLEPGGARLERFVTPRDLP